ncbi:Autoinducer binding domain protein [Pelagimonas phthalicica]|uniref:Autoinducer binding domain protein n=1 Tax=Pelagimonas phthalicica TaxID=1037362 RepID=A0A238JBN4_9RHOB|nr:autoinducer binding domain-containing protein [Pelagimonas phthalicica]TDS94209.1 autoinducer binding domain-containing protein [Pelagimonas phthalicica]SMX27266.1 Autoinducer binding domain protein [Pelagimonas phthalicica]
MLFLEGAPEPLGNIADKGFAIGVGNFLTGEIEVASNYANDWQQLYNEKNWAFVDPVIRMGLQGSDIQPWQLGPDHSEFTTAANDFGLQSGWVASSFIGGSRCIAGLSATNTSNATHAKEILGLVRKYHLQQLVNKARSLSAGQLDLVNLFAMGLRTKEVAATFGVSIDAIKQRKLTIQRHIGVTNFLVVVNVCTRVDVENHLINHGH